MEELEKNIKKYSLELDLEIKRLINLKSKRS